GLVRNAALARLREHAGDALWVEVLGGESKFDGHHGAATLDNRETGLLVGVDRRYGDWRAGAFLGYSDSDFDVDRRDSSGQADSYHAGVYGARSWGANTVRAGLAYSWHDVETERHAFGQKLEGQRDAHSAQAFVEASHRIGEDRGWFEPFAGLAWVNQQVDRMQENGGSAALEVQRDDSDV